MSTNQIHLEHALIRTILFFDLFDYPLTDTELWKFLLSDTHCSTSLVDIRKCLVNSHLLRTVIESADGFYYLRGREHLCMLRRDRALFSYRKYRRILPIIRLLAHIPFVRMICVCNTLGIQAARDDSDIDLFIIARAGHLWFVRFFCTSIAQVLGLRPHTDRSRDTVCLSFYISDDALNLSPLRYPTMGSDIYLAYWITWCAPLYDDAVYNKFFSANAWIREVLPNILPCRPIPRRRVALSPLQDRIKALCETIITVIGFPVERCMRSIQLRLFPPAIRNQMNKGTGVVVSDSILKFHVADKRNEIQEKFLMKCKEVGISYEGFV